MRKIFLLLSLFIAISACKKDEETQLSPSEQSKVDNDILVEYMKIHVLKTEIFRTEEETDQEYAEKIKRSSTKVDWKVENLADDAPEGTETLFDLMGESYIAHNEDGTDYKVYYYRIDEGVGANPVDEDEVVVDYFGNYLSGTNFDNSLRNQSCAEFPLDKVIKGWTLAIPMFKIGEVRDGVNEFPGVREGDQEEGEEADYEVNPYREKMDNYGRGIILIPSGLAYGPNGSSGISPNSVLSFDIVLFDIKEVEEDN